MLEPRPLGLGRGQRSDRHGVIERHLALASDPGISRWTGLSRNTVRKYLRSDIVEPRSASPTARASSIPTPTSYLACSFRRRPGCASKSGRSSNCTPIWSPSAMTVPTIGWRRSPASGRPLGSESNRSAGRVGRLAPARAERIVLTALERSVLKSQFTTPR